MGKGEIARYEQFLLFPQCFQKACFPEVSKGVIVWEWVESQDCAGKSYAASPYKTSTTHHWFGIWGINHNAIYSTTLAVNVRPK